MDLHVILWWVFLAGLGLLLIGFVVLFAVDCSRYLRPAAPLSDRWTWAWHSIAGTVAVGAALALLFDSLALGPLGAKLFFGGILGFFLGGVFGSWCLIRMHESGVVWLGDRILKARLPQLRAELQHDDAVRRRLAVERIGQLGAESTLPELIAMLRDPSADVRYHAATVLGQFDEEGERVLPALTAALGDGDLRVRAGAAFALCEMRGQEAAEVVPVLLAALQHPDEEVRQLAASWLGELGLQADTVVPALLQALQDGDEDVRSSVIEALGSFGPKAAAAKPALLEARKDSSAQVREAVEFALACITEPPEDDAEAGEKPLAAPLRTVNVELPPEVVVAETSEVTRYHLPWRPWGERGRLFGALANAVNAPLVLYVPGWFLAMVLIQNVGIDPDNEWRGFLVLGLLGLAIVVYTVLVLLTTTRWKELAGSTRIDLSAGELKVQRTYPASLWFWGLWSEPEVSRTTAVRRLVTYPLTLTFWGRPLTGGPFGGLAALHVECEGRENFWLAFAYPRSWLTALGRTLAGRLGIEHVEASRHLTAPPARFKELPEGVGEDVGYPPPKSRLLVERRPQGLMLTIQPERGWAVGWIWLLGLVISLVAVVGLIAAALAGETAGMIAAPVVLVGGVLVLTGAWHASTRRIEMLADPTGLTVYRSGGPLRTRLQEWRKTQIESVRGEWTMNKNGVTRRLVLHTTSGQRVILYSDMPGDEVPHLATLLRRELGVPGVGVF